MAHVIGLLQGKGGTGKTTTTINLAGALLETGRAVAVIDLDPQQSAAAWAGPESSLVDRVHIMDDETINERFQAVAADMDYVLIDTPPTLTTREPLIAAQLADLLIVPCQAGAQEYQRVHKTLNSVALFKTPFRLLASMVDLRETISRDVAGTLAQRGPVFETVIRRAVAMREATFTRQWIGEYAPNCLSHHQFRHLAAEVIEILEAEHVAA